MAADKKGAKQSEEDEATAAAANAATETKKKRKKLLLIIGGGFLLVAISIGATVAVIKLLAPKKAPGEATTTSSEASVGAESSVAAKASESGEPAMPIIYLALKPNFTVNYDVNGRQRFLQAELTVMYRDEAVLKILELHMPAVRNGLVLLLSSQTFDDLQTVEGKEKLRTAALKIVQNILIKEQLEAPEKSEKSKKVLPNIEQILFTNFVMQ